MDLELELYGSDSKNAANLVRYFFTTNTIQWKARSFRCSSNSRNSYMIRLAYFKFVSYRVERELLQMSSLVKCRSFLCRANRSTEEAAPEMVDRKADSVMARTSEQKRVPMMTRRITRAPSPTREMKPQRGNLKY